MDKHKFLIIETLKIIKRNPNKDDIAALGSYHQGGQLRAVAIACVVLGVSMTYLTNNSREGILYLALGYLFGNLWLLWGALSFVLQNSKYIYSNIYITKYIIFIIYESYKIISFHVAFFQIFLVLVITYPPLYSAVFPHNVLFIPPSPLFHTVWSQDAGKSNWY